MLLSLGCLLSIAPVLGKPADEEADGEEGDDEAEEEDYLGHEIKECATLTGEKEGAPVWTYRCKDIFTHLMMLMMTVALTLDILSGVLYLLSGRMLIIYALMITIVVN